MSKFENIFGQFDSYDEPWEGKTGMAVEDFITRKLQSGNIESISYENSLLTLHKADGSTVETTVTVETPTYDYGVYVYGLKITNTNGVSTIYTSLNDTVVSQYTSGKLYEVGIAIYATSSTSVSVSDKVGAVKTKVSYGSRSKSLRISNIPYADCIINSEGNISGIVGTAEEIANKVAWVDVTDLFTIAQSNMQISAQIQEEGFTDKKHTLSSKITTEVLKLTYVGQYVNKTRTASFNLTGGSGTYKLEIYINGTKKTDVPEGMSYPNLVSGLNQMIVRAVNVNDASIYTDWLMLDVICTVECYNTVVAINGVRDSITNNGVATLYDIKVYSPSQESLELTTYLETNRPTSTPKPTQKLKYEVISASSYNSDNVYETSYQKYMELSGNNTKMYLLIHTGNTGDYYSFPIINSSGRVSSNKFKEMTVEELNADLAYYSAVKPDFNFDQITGASNNVFITNDYASESTPANISDTLEPSNGWYEENGRTLFRITAQKNPIFKNPITLGLSDNCTIEMGFKTKNISNKNKPILTIGNLQLRPTQVCWWTNSYKEEELDIPGSDTLKSFTERNSQFQENVETHVIITIQKNWSVDPNGIYSPKDILPSDELKNQYDSKAASVAKHLARIYINGVIDREFLFDTDAELSALVASSMQIAPTTADIDFYLFRTYNTTVLNYSQVQKNYISFMANKSDKEAFFDKNDIIGDSGEISYVKSREKYNTLVLIMPSFLRVPNITWNVDDPSDSDIHPEYKKVGSTLFIGYADPNVNQQYGGRLNHGQIKGQGSSAKRYLWWNPQFSLNKLKIKVEDPETGEKVEKKIKSEFRPYSTMDPDTNKFDLSAEPQVGYYNMPPYEGQVDQTPMKYTKMVGKINFASSMQSHKQGACKLYDDAYKTAFGVNALYSGGRKAVHEEAFLYFYWETDMEDVSNIELADLLANNDKIKFAGFQTWGPGKGDDACSGYDEDLTPEYLMLEGGENSDSSVNFRVPWMALQRGNEAEYSTSNYKLTDFPTVTKQVSLDQPWKNLLIDDESIVYASRGAWDVDYGFEELETESGFVYFDIAGKYNEDTKEATGPKNSLKIFRDFYDTVYKYNYNYIIDEEATSPTAEWNSKTGMLQRYVVTSGDFYIDGQAVTDHQSGDMYRYEEYSGKWVKAGLYYDNSKSGADGWERLNIFDLGYELGEEQLEFIKDVMKEKFIEEVSKYLDLDDIAFHQAFIKFLSGTDNRAKNSYFQIIGPYYKEVEDEEGNTTLELTERWDNKIRLIGDDLDTIMVTDNNGLQSKPYNLLESSYNADMDVYWGDANNIFFQMFDQCFEGRIKTQLNNILSKCNIQRNNVLSPLSYFYKAFFSIQETYPAVAYNHVSKLWYENAQSVLDTKIISGYNNNNISEPVSQSHGSCLPCEAQFMKERYNFLTGYAQNLTVQDTDLNTYAGSGGSTAEMILRIEFEPYQDFYPNYYADAVKYFDLKDLEGNAIESEFDTIKYLSKAGQTYVTEINTASTNQGLYFIDLYKSLNILGLGTSSLAMKGDRLTNLTIDNAEMADYPLFAGRPASSFPGGLTSDLPVLENLSLRNITLGDTLDCSEYVKLINIDLSGSTLNQIIFPETGTLSVVTIPAVKIFKIYNNPGLTEVNIADVKNIEEVYIDCSKCGAFDVAAFLESLSECDLKSVDIRNANGLKLTEETINHLLGCDFNITGTIKIIEKVGSENLKDIAFSTKQELVNRFGNIDDSNITDGSKLYVEYTHSDITDVSGPGEISVFGTLNKPIAGLFPVTITKGNKVVVLDGTNPFDASVDGYLDITYEITKVSGVDTLANMASINSRTGYLTVKKESDDFVAKVTIKVAVKNSTVPLTHDVTVKFAWKAPQVGDFAYVDGSFSSAYDPNKTLAGLVYAAKRDSDTAGTVYIMGKEYTSNKQYYIGYADESDKSGSDTTILNLQRLNDYVTSLGLSTDYDYVANVAAKPSMKSHIGTKIVGGYYDDYSEDAFDTRSIEYFVGKENTLDYVNHVNTQLLPKLSAARDYISQDAQGIWSIPSMDKLNTLYDRLPSISGVTGSGTDQPLNLISSLLFPYFYSSYLYEPTINSGEVIDEQYKQGNWYAPSAAELARIIYYTGYSVAGANFEQNRVLTDYSDTLVTDGGGNAIKHTNDFDSSSSIEVGDDDFHTPIFSLAYDRMGNSLYQVWKDAATTANICTTVNSEVENYSYQTYYYQGSYTTGWIVGDYTTQNWGSYGLPRLAWRLNPHYCVPHVQYNYAKP